MTKTGLVVAMLMMTLQAPSARGQSCSDFNKAMDATKAANLDMDAQLTRIKAMGQPPHFDAGACKVAKQLREQARDTAKLADPSCGPDTDQIVGALGDMSESAEREIKLYCTPEVGTLMPVKPTDNRGGGFIFSDSDRRLLTVNDLRGLSLEQLRIARNEIYARKGRYFKDETLRAHFAQFSWYQPDRWDIALNNVESSNVRLIQSMEK
jgi:hypothetical protein